jgi:hypothetical protein
MRRRYLIGEFPGWAIPDSRDELAIEVEMTDDGSIVSGELRYRPAGWTSWSAPIPLAVVMTLPPRRP